MSACRLPLLVFHLLTVACLCVWSLVDSLDAALMVFRNFADKQSSDLSAVRSQLFVVMRTLFHASQVLLPLLLVHCLSVDGVMMTCVSFTTQACPFPPPLAVVFSPIMCPIGLLLDLLPHAIAHTHPLPSVGHKQRCL